MNQTKIHSFHIPVMGTGFSVDTPAKVAKYGISAVISLVDDTLIEEMRKLYCERQGLEYQPITKYDEDFRARRITAYLDLVDDVVNESFLDVKNSSFKPGTEITKYFEMLSDQSALKTLYNDMLKEDDLQKKELLQQRLREQMKPGDINVNIMTKLDRANLDKKRTALPVEFSDALAALRGYAKSKLNSSIVFSAGINRRLYSYLEQFDDFFADENGFIKKKIILKVSDYRSSIIQGKFFAKKGLWVSEFRIESGLNCGGHAFASDGYLMGPILEEFKVRRQEMTQSLFRSYTEGLKNKSLPLFDEPHKIEITAQGGIGTPKEDQFLLSYYQLDGTGWATPFLLVPEATNVDEPTMEKLLSAGEEDLYLSDVSPLGVPFNNLRGNPSDVEKQRRIDVGKPGSACPKGHLVSNTEFTDIPICTASRQYQKLKIEALEKLNLASAAFKKKYDEVVTKACICNDLAEGVLINHQVEKRGSKRFAAICPGPNLAYFSRIATLKEMVGHIYGRINLLNDTYRPNMFIKELKMYVEYFTKEIKKAAIDPTDKQKKYLQDFRQNMLDGISYYKQLFPQMVKQTSEYQKIALEELEYFKQKMEFVVLQYKNIFDTTSVRV